MVGRVCSLPYANPTRSPFRGEPVPNRAPATLEALDMLARAIEQLRQAAYDEGYDDAASLTLPDLPADGPAHQLTQ